MRRIARIAPLVFVVSVAYGLLLEGRVDTFAAINLYVLNYWTEAITPSTSPLWSLAVEMHFYLAIGIAVAVLGTRGVWLLLPAAAIVTGLRVYEGAYGSIATHLRVDEILAGGLVAMLWAARDGAVGRRVFAVLPFLFWPIFLLWIASAHPDAGALNYARPYLGAGLMASLLSLSGGWQVSLLSMRALAYVAAISFALYVIHSPFRAYWFNEGTTLERYGFKRPLAFVCIFALAHLSTFHFERPITNWARDFTRRRFAS